MSRKERRIAEVQNKKKQATADAANSLQPQLTRAGLIAQALAFQQSGKLSEAAKLYNILLASDPHNFALLTMLGMIELQQGNPSNAILLTQKALLAKPDNAEAYYICGLAQNKLKQYANALESYDKAIALKPDYADAHNNRGMVLQQEKRYDEALASYNKAIAFNPSYSEAYTNRGTLFNHFKRYDEAMAEHDKALAINPHYATAYYNKGISLRELKRYSEALAAYNKAIALQPDFMDAKWSKGLILLALGEFEEGWHLYEYRWQTKTVQVEVMASQKPLWLGKESLVGKTILLYAEQGFGDIIQFCRYLPMVEALGANIILGVPNPMTKLLSTLKSTYLLLGQGTHEHHHDFQCSLMSLPLALGTTLKTIPADVPYLYTDPDIHALWQKRLGAKTKHRIGLAWSGNVYHKNNQNRSIVLKMLTPLLEHDFEFHSLQTEVRPDDVAVLANSKITSHAEYLNDFADTAALISEMDLIISVDTSVAHLAGALGKPVWILLPFVPDWRWLVDREDSPWYPTARLFRQQKPDDWDSVIARVRKELGAL